MKSRYLEGASEVFWKHIQNKSKILLYGDYDTDGVMSIKIIDELLNTLGYTNKEIHLYQSRSHTLNNRLYHHVLSCSPDLVMIFDAGSSNLDILKKIRAVCEDVIVIDHHETDNFYSNFELNKITIFNNYLDKLERESDLVGCGGYFSFLLAEYVLDKNNLLYTNVHKVLALLGLIALYADIIYMNTTEARRLYDLSRDAILPIYLKVFQTNYQLQFTKRFITWTLAPQLNSTFRWEIFEPINRLFFDANITLEEAQICASVMQTIKLRSAGMVHKYTPLLEPQVKGEFITANLSKLDLTSEKVPSNFLLNNTGRFANQLCTQYNLAALTFCDNGQSGIGGSCRDHQGRDILSKFKYRFNANGHNSAFGISLAYPDYPKFLALAETIRLPELQTKRNTIDMLDQLNYTFLEKIAKENEFCTSGQCDLTSVRIKFSPTAMYENEGGNFSYMMGKYKNRNVYTVGKRKITNPCIVTITPFLTDGIKFELED